MRRADPERRGGICIVCAAFIASNVNENAMVCLWSCFLSARAVLSIEHRTCAHIEATRSTRNAKIPPPRDAASDAREVSRAGSFVDMHAFIASDVLRTFCFLSARAALSIEHRTCAHTEATRSTPNAKIPRLGDAASDACDITRV